MEEKTVTGRQCRWCDVAKHTIPPGAKIFPAPGGGESCVEHQGQPVPEVPIEALLAGALA
jgi:hypothetical protein